MSPTVRTALPWATVFLGSALLFMAQPMVATALLPALGGTPAVWVGCLVFFQLSLVVGYAWAHAGPRVLGLRRHAAVHGVMLALAALRLPWHLGSAVPPRQGDPTAWLLTTLVATVGLPAVVLSASAPLVQRWVARASQGDALHETTPSDTRGDAREPYRLYVASNLGSLIALAAYPTVVQPHAGGVLQSGGWAVGYGVLVALTLVTAWGHLHGAGTPPTAAPTAEAPSPTVQAGLRWALQAFIPSSLLAGVTTYITTDLAPVPLLWVLPLGLYLGSWVAAFSGHPTAPSPRVVAPLAAFAVLLFVFTVPGVPAGLVLGAFHLALLFAVGCVLHGQLAFTRPGPGHLTGFYLWTCVGGALGGVLHALVAPQLFPRMTEYPLTLALLPLVLPRTVAERSDRVARLRDYLVPAGIGLLTLGLVSQNLTGVRGTLVTFGLPVSALAVLSAGRRVRLGLGLIAVALASAVPRAGVTVSRSYYGSLRVERGAKRVTLLHGTTIHGMQSLDPARRLEPAVYYDRTGPMGAIVRAQEPRWHNASVGVVGLGAGTLAAYARPGQHWTFFELDPQVVTVARRDFTFLADCRGQWEVVVGDGRLALARRPDDRYDLLILDAFSSDAVPTHLVTREALALYRHRLSPRGALAFNVTNRYVRLDEVLAVAAHDAGWVARFRRDMTTSNPWASRSAWVYMTRPDDPTVPEGFHQLSAPHGRTPWTDDHTDLWHALQWWGWR